MLDQYFISLQPCLLTHFGVGPDSSADNIFQPAYDSLRNCRSANDDPAGNALVLLDSITFDGKGCCYRHIHGRILPVIKITTNRPLLNLNMREVTGVVNDYSSIFLLYPGSFSFSTLPIPGLFRNSHPENSLLLVPLFPRLPVSARCSYFKVQCASFVEVSSSSHIGGEFFRAWFLCGGAPSFSEIITRRTW